jgi:hypothetical protein
MMPTNPTLPQPPFTSDEWDRTPESVRRFVLELQSVADRFVSGADAHRPGGESPRGRSNPGQVVFVSDRPLAREAKLAWGLQRAGWEVVLLCGQPPAFDAGALCSAVHPYRDYREAVEIARRYAPLVYHVFSCWSFDVAAALLRNGLGPIVHDDYDVMAGLLRDEVAMRNSPGQKQLERYCLEKAHGHCCRSLESQIARHRLGYRMDAPRILITDMCWGHGAPDVAKLSSLDGELHVVYCGNVFNGPPEAQGDNNFHYLTAATLSRRGAHYHLYPSSRELAEIYRAHLPRYMAEHGAPEYAHVHDPVPCDRLVAELAQYDLGVQILSRNVEMSETDPTYHREKATYAAANKVFDYADAGIPVVIHGGMFQRAIVRRYRLGRSIGSIDEIADAPVGERVEPPAALTVEANVARLARFYRRVALGLVRSAA